MDLGLLNTSEARPIPGCQQSISGAGSLAGARIPFVRVGDRAVRYQLSELEAYIVNQVRHSTSDRGPRS